VLQPRRLPVYKKIVNENVRKWMIKEFLFYKLARLGYVDSEVVRTPLGTRIIIYAERPARIIGRKGVIVKELAQILTAKFNVENPQIDVTDVSKIEPPENYPQILAYRIANAMAREVKFRRAAFIAMRQLIEANVRGAEIVISGKLSSERARFEKYTYGRVYKSGYDADYSVRRFVAHVLLKPGIYGVEVKVAPATTRYSDDFKIRPPVKPEAVQVVESRGG